MNLEALLALIGDLYAQVRDAETRAADALRERDTYKSMLDAVRPDEPAPEPPTE
jgi:hypothetical protein